MFGFLFSFQREILFLLVFWIFLCVLIIGIRWVGKGKGWWMNFLSISVPQQSLCVMLVKLVVLRLLAWLFFRFFLAQYCLSSCKVCAERRVVGRRCSWWWYCLTWEYQEWELGFRKLLCGCVWFRRVCAFHAVAQDDDAWADADGVGLVAVDDGVWRHNVPLQWFGIWHGEEVRVSGFVRNKGIVLGNGK